MSNIIHFRDGEHNPVAEAFALIEQFDADGQSTGDHPLLTDPYHLFNHLRSERNLYQMLRAARGNYYALEAVLRAWLFVTVEDHGADDAARTYITALNHTHGLARTASAA